MRALRATAVAFSVLLAVLTVPLRAAADPADLDPPAEAPLLRGMATVTAQQGRIRLDLASTTPKPLRRMHRKGLCASFTQAPVGTAPGASPPAGASVCLAGRRWATVARPGAARLRIPVSVRRAKSGDLRVQLRQADLQLPPGPARIVVSCTVGCGSRAGVITLPPLVLQSCRAQGPWLVHSGAETVGKAVAITFDDGPGPMTEQVLDILAKHGVSATFFQLGRMIEQQPDLLRRIRREGHVLGNHSFSHPVLTGADRSQLTRTQGLLDRHGGFDTCLFRAPYGENPPGVVALAKSLGMVTVHWNVDPGDWRGLTASQMVATSLQQTRPGSILVFHDGEYHPDMVAGLPRLLESLRQRGYRFLTLPELLRLPVRYR